MSLSDSALTIQAGMGAQTTTVNLVRTNFTSAVSLSAGHGPLGTMPPGITASFSPNPAIGNSSALILTVMIEAVPGVYALTVNGDETVDGASAFVPLTLTVTAPPTPAYALELSPAAVSIAQGGGAAHMTAYLVRTNFSGNVALSVENLPSGVWAFFYPRDTTSASFLNLYVGADGTAPAGTFTNVLVRGKASGLADQTSPLTVTITVAPFVLTLSSSAVSIAQSDAKPAATVNVVRNDFTDPVTLSVGWLGEDHDVLPPGVTAALAPNLATGNSSVLTLTVGAAAVPGVYDLFVFGEASTASFCCTPTLTLTVTASAGEGMLVSQWAAGATASAEWSLVEPPWQPRARLTSSVARTTPTRGRPEHKTAWTGWNEIDAVQMIGYP